MKHVLWVCLLLQVLWGCDYARMKDDEALRTYETSIPAMPRKAIPSREASNSLDWPIPRTCTTPSPSLPKPSSGKGKVRVLLRPVPRSESRWKWNGWSELLSAPDKPARVQVQEQSDGELFYRISLGYKRQPPLAATVAEEERWAIIQYIRSIADRTKS